MGIKYKALVESYQAVVEERGQRAADLMVREVFSKHEKPQAAELGRLFEAIFGTHAYLTAARDRYSDEPIRPIMEAAGATSVAQFTNITGQIVFSAILPKYESEEFVVTKMIPTVDTKLSGEKIPGITRIGDAAQVVAEGGEFPLVGVSETYIHTPTTVKRGFRTAITKEAIFFDRTGELLDRFGQSAYDFGLGKEKRGIDALLDENAGAVSAMAGGHRYHWRDTSIATYGDSSGSHSWDNLQATNTLTDWQSLQNAWLLLKAMKDPDINEPMNFLGKQLFVTPQLAPTAYRIKRTIETRTNVGGYATTGNLQSFAADSPVPSYFDFDIVTSQLIADRLGTDTSWFYGDIGRMLRYMQNWPLEVLQAPAMSEDEFKRDIVVQYRVSERGAFSTWEPRAMIKSTVA
jgi:hypothetical protein